ncbi:hypothetical protein N325_00515, partial [Colius striatus]
MMCKVLIFSCISVVMIMTATYGAPVPPEKTSLLKALLKDLKYLQNSTDKIHLDLYTPNEKEECSRQTLQCYLTEMGTLANEIQDMDVGYLRNIIKNLQCLKDVLPHGTGCKICEANDKKEFSGFHQELTSFLTSMLK